MKRLEGVYLHPMFVHFPQALFPVGLVFFLLYLATGRQGFEEGAALVTAAGALAAPVTTATGFLDWRWKYKGYLTPVFRIKIAGAFVLVALSAAAAALRAALPQVAALPLSGAGWLYAALLAACAADCVILGYYGGRLVFH